MPEHLTIDSPVGKLLLRADDSGLTAVYFEEHRGRADGETWPADGPSSPDAHAPAESSVLAAAAAQLAAYFDGRLTAFDLPLSARGTPFQERVWAALRAIPYGQTISYAELARRVDAPRAVRAVGAANARNPLSIVVPCHRVIGANGALTGFGGGVDRKRWLLEHEQAAAASAASDDARSGGYAAPAAIIAPTSP